MELKSDSDDNNQSINFIASVLVTLLTSLDSCLSSGHMISSLLEFSEEITARLCLSWATLEAGKFVRKLWWGGGRTELIEA